MTDNNDLAQRLYGAPQFSRAESATTPAQPAKSVPEPAQEATPAERLYRGGGPTADSPATYDGAALADGFDALQHTARMEGDEEAIEVLNEARQQAAGLLHELAVPVTDAKELAITFGRYAREPLSVEALERKNEVCELELRKEWRGDYDRNLALARQAYQHALRRMPSLRDVFDAGAGSDPKVIRALYAASKRMAGGRK